MSNILENLSPRDVFMYFERLSNIPRGSKNEKAVSDYLVNFAKEQGLEYIQDKALNVIIKKPASPGYEDAPTVILQGHMDMVCEKNQDVLHDFEKDPLQLKVVGDMVYANGTTLGADNGVAVAYGLALLARKDLPHPALEVVFTTDEENGMEGVILLEPEHLKGRLLINIDSEEEGKLLVSSAGGINTRLKLPIIWEKASEQKVNYEVRVKGLLGGHSGMSIHKGMGNSNKIMGRFLMDLSSIMDFDIACINGGVRDNAIPREAVVSLLIEPNQACTLIEKVETWQSILKNELLASDPDVRIELELIDKKINKVFSKETKDSALKILYLIPNGIKTMSMSIAGLVESSTNIGVVETTESQLIFKNVVRSCIKSLKQEILNEQKLVADLFGAEYITAMGYSEWQYDPESKLRILFEKVYSEMYGKKPEIIALHAGIECSLFKEKLGEVDMISFGPNIYDVHTPDEHMSISSVQRTWEYLLAVLKEMK